MLNKAINKGFWHGFSMAIIGAGANFVYAFAFLMGTGSLIFNSKLRITIQIIGLLFLLYVGAKEILIPVNQKYNLTEKFFSQIFLLLCPILFPIQPL